MSILAERNELDVAAGVKNESNYGDCQDTYEDRWFHWTNGQFAMFGAPAMTGVRTLPTDPHRGVRTD